MTRLNDVIEFLKRLPKMFVGQLNCIRARGAFSRLPLVMFVFSLVLASFAYGFIADQFHIFPYETIKSAARTGATFYKELVPGPNQLLVGLTNIKADRIESQRIRPVAELQTSERYLLMGGPDQYREYCPQHGCVAVVLRRDGHLVHAFPFRPDELAEHTIADRPFERLLYDPARALYPVGAIQLEDGGLIVTFQRINTFPYGGGVARITADGSIVWYRQDYAHHWPASLGNGQIAVLTTDIVKGPLEVPIKDGKSFTLTCTGLWDDGVEILDLNGKVVDRIPLLTPIVRSRFRQFLHTNLTWCDTLHLNYVRPIGAELAAAVPGALPGDLIISVSSLSAFAIIGRRDHQIKTMVRGSFAKQHNVLPTRGTKILLVDNWGSDPTGGPSRLLEYDFATHREKTLFPGPQTPEGTRTYTYDTGHVSLSADGRKALFAVSDAGIGYEIELDTGKILTEFDDLQDMRNIPGFPGDPRHVDSHRVMLYAIYYAKK